MSNSNTDIFPDILKVETTIVAHPLCIQLFERGAMMIKRSVVIFGNQW
jgi:hypothetical protein